MEVQMIGGANPRPMNGHANHHNGVREATEVPRDWSSVLHRRVGQRPTRLNASAGSPSCCIFRVHRNHFNLNPEVFKPRIVSIGPYHHEREEVKPIEEQKSRVFEDLLTRTRSFGADFNDYFNAVASKEKEIRDCYSEPLNYESSALIEMMVYDGCFIIEVFRVIENIVAPHRDDPLFKMWSPSMYRREFLHLENQVPFFILEMLYDMSNGPNEPQWSLVELALQFFNHGVPRRPEVLVKYSGLSDVKHLLHLIQLCLTNLPSEMPREFNGEHLQLVHSVTKLRCAGIKFKPGNSVGWLDIQFKNGVLEIPPLTINEWMSSFFLNCIEFERCYCDRLRHITSYVVFMGCLMVCADDASFLSDHHVLKNHYGPYADVASLFNDLAKGVGFEIGNSYLAGVMEDLNSYHRNQWRVRWTGLKHKYFGTPWSLISALATSLLLVLTFIQSFIALYAYVFPRKQ